ncbi:MAG: hypothetical protein IIB38_16130, partial [Candidatus Hydrogenedentes bacterium]|nr:hypothetical protein [Candidatus Hydrogenedentota bacterium]
MKKHLCFLACIALATSTLTGCGGKEDTSSSTAVPHSDVPLSAETKAAIENWAQQFEPSVLSAKEIRAELTWFAQAAAPYRGMKITSVAEGIRTHVWESEVLAKAFTEITGIQVAHDIIGEGEEIDFPGLSGPDEFMLFRQKARSFLRQHMDVAAVYKLRMNIQLTADDLDALEETMKEIGSVDAIRQAAEEAHGLGLFARALVGLDREAATTALSEFTAGSTMTANQITFAKLVVERLAEHGLAETKNFYDPPFTDVAPEGPQGLFTDAELDRLKQVL